MKSSYTKTLSLALLAVGLFGPLAAANAGNWSFRLLNSPTALNMDSPGGESIRFNGSGTFDPAQGLVSACGTYTIYNGFDHPNGPIVYGTWHSTGFVSFSSGSHGRGPRPIALTISIETDDLTGGGVGTGQMTLLPNGIQGPIYADEPYIIPPGGSGGGTQFQNDDDVSFFPNPF